MKTDKKPSVIEAFRAGCSWREAALASGVAVTTIWRWAKLDPEFAAAIKDACVAIDHEVEATTFANCLDSDPAHNVLRMFWLKSRVSDTYGERLKIEHSGEIEIGWGDTQGEYAAPAPGPVDGTDEPGPVQGAGVRPAVGKD